MSEMEESIEEEFKAIINPVEAQFLEARDYKEPTDCEDLNKEDDFYWGTQR